MAVRVLESFKFGSSSELLHFGEEAEQLHFPVCILENTLLCVEIKKAKKQENKLI